MVGRPITEKPTLFLYDLSRRRGPCEKAYHMQELLLEHALDIARSCGCESGCPSCVGPVSQVGELGKADAIAILKELLA